MEDTTESSPVAVVKNVPSEDIGKWLGQKKPSCLVCQSNHVNDIHRYRYEGQSLREVAETLKKRKNVEISFNTLGRHFKYHFLVRESRSITIAGVPNTDIVKTSIDTMISNLQNNRSTFFDAVGSISQSRLEQLKQYQELSEEIEAALAELTPPGSDKSGFTNLDAGSEALIARWNYLQEQIDFIKNSLSKTFIDVQKVIAKVDDEVLKNHIFMVKTFLLKELTKSFSNLLNEAVKEGLLALENKAAVGAKVVEILQYFEGNLTIDFLYQQSIEDMKTEKQV